MAANVSESASKLTSSMSQTPSEDVADTKCSNGSEPLQNGSGSENSLKVPVVVPSPEEKSTNHADGNTAPVSEPPRKIGLFLRPSALSNKSGTLLKPSLINVSSLSKPTSEEPSESHSNSANKAVKTDTSVPASPATPSSLFSSVPLSNPNYVFGQNIKDRVVAATDSASNGNGEVLLFSTASADGTSTKDKADEKETASLVEDAARCQEQRTTKRKYEEVPVTTGEEGETNIMQVVVKLFAFEGGSWVERGRGMLRLNDRVSGDGEESSRIVIRTLGSLRVILNAKIWSDMELTRASEKSLRITAMDSSSVPRVFLIQASPADINSIFSRMSVRIKKCHESKKPSETDERAPKIAALDPAVVTSSATVV